MKLQRLALALTAINLVLLFPILTQERSTAAAQAISPVLRTHTLELLDDRGRIRAHLKAESDGEVVLKLSDKNGIIRVKS